jgi:SOUL heme-binding protein
MGTATNDGFRQLAGYIFGGNTAKSSIAMTAPVMDTTKTSENIKMTVPVMDTLSNSGKHIIAFTMPSKYTLETLPKPSKANIRFREVAQSRKAVLRYNWYATPDRVEAQKRLLTEFLSRDGYKTK